MVWGGTSLQASRTLSAVRQGDEILRPSVRPHVARVCRQFLDNERISGIGRPSLSPDLNPIENLMYGCI